MAAARVAYCVIRNMPFFMCLFSLNKLIITIASLRDRASLNGKGRITISKSQRTVHGYWRQLTTRGSP